jgi:hypothetical protein
MSLATNLNLDLRWLHNTAWVYWQVMDGGGWGLLDSDPVKGTIKAVNTKYVFPSRIHREDSVSTNGNHYIITKALKLEIL